MELYRFALSAGFVPQRSYLHPKNSFWLFLFILFCPPHKNWVQGRKTKKWGRRIRRQTISYLHMPESFLSPLTSNIIFIVSEHHLPSPSVWLSLCLSSLSVSLDRKIYSRSSSLSHNLNIFFLFLFPFSVFLFSFNREESDEKPQGRLLVWI